MASTAAALKAQYDLHTRLFNNALAGISDSEANSRSNEHVNHMKWVAGHLLNGRLENMNQLTGGEPDRSYTESFGRNSVLDPTGAKYPSLDEIRDKWNEVSPAISERINHLPEELLDSKAPAQSPIPDETFRGLVAFIVSHEAYHVGQLSILRKIAGKDAMSYN